MAKIFVLALTVLAAFLVLSEARPQGGLAPNQNLNSQSAVAQEDVDLAGAQSGLVRNRRDPKPHPKPGFWKGAATGAIAGGALGAITGK